MTETTIRTRGLSTTLAPALALALALAAPSAAQETTATVSAGVSSFDLSGTGTAPALSVRVDRELHPKLRLEGALTALRPDQQFGRTTTFLAPELQLQWAPVELDLFTGAVRIQPYLGAGTGWGWDVRPDAPDRSDPSFSGALGLRLPLGAARAGGLEVEARARFLDTGFTGSTGDFTLGWYWEM